MLCGALPHLRGKTIIIKMIMTRVGSGAPRHVCVLLGPPAAPCPGVPGAKSASRPPLHVLDNRSCVTATVAITTTTPTIESSIRNIGTRLHRKCFREFFSRKFSMHAADQYG